jgi:sugar phosphate isomerase/epimerase
MTLNLKMCISTIACLFTLSLQAQSVSTKPNSKFEGIQIGVITYSYRSMPHDVDKLIEFCLASGISAIELMGDAVEEYAGKPKADFSWRSGPRQPMTDLQKAQVATYNKQVADWRATVSMDKFMEVRKKFDAAGIKIYAFKPNAFSSNNTDEEVSYGMRVAKVLGAKSVTLELPNDPMQSKRLGELGEKHKMLVGYHNHTQATDVLWDVALSQSPNNSINFDAGHYLAAGGKNTIPALLAFIEKNHKRISSMHLKDRTTPEHGAGNLPWGTGDTPMKEIFQLMKDKKMKFPVSVELEYAIPEGSDAIKEVVKCVSHAKKMIVSE